MSEKRHVIAKKQWRNFLKEANEIGDTDLTVGISASFTPDNLAPMLGAALIEQGLKPNLRLAEYNQVIQTCMNYKAQFHMEPDVIIFLWRIEELLLNEFTRFIMGQQDALMQMHESIDRLVKSLAHLRSLFKGIIIVSLPPFPQNTLADLRDINVSINAGFFHRLTVNYFIEQTKGVFQLRLLDMDSLQRSFGAQAAFDSRKWYLYKQPYTESFLWELAHLLSRMIKIDKQLPKKCIILDCDNTLWGGIIGEDRIEGILIGKEGFPGSAFYDLQMYLLYLRSQGIMLAIVSKNNEADVWEVFEQHDGMVLKREHISASRINWGTKSSNIVSIANELNIGMDSIVFVDDSLFEISEVKSALPEVVTVLLSDEPAYMIEDIKRLQLFDKLDITEEDRKRGEMIDAERRRSVYRGMAIEKDFIATMDLKIELGKAKLSQLGRVAQLINKTNQFNLSTVRRTLEQIKTLYDSPNWCIYSVRVADKFGDYGLVGVILVEKNNKSWRIDTFLLSCRVLSRNVETVMLNCVIKEACEFGAKIVEAIFIPTTKNVIVKNFLPSHGFVKCGQNLFEISVENIPISTTHATISISQELDDSLLSRS